MEGLLDLGGIPVPSLALTTGRGQGTIPIPIPGHDLLTAPFYGEAARGTVSRVTNDDASIRDTWCRIP